MTTINLLTPNQADIETDLTGFAVMGAGVTMSRDAGASWQGAASLKVVCDGLHTFQGAKIVKPFADLQPNGAYAFSVYMFGSGTVNLVIQQEASPFATYGFAQFTLTGGWARYSVVGTLPGVLPSGNLSFQMATGGTAAALTYNADALQVEANSATTAFVPGSSGVAPATKADRPQYTIRVRDASGNPQGALSAYDGGDLLLRMNDVGKWALTVRADDPLRSLFAVRGAGIIVSRDRGDGSGAQTLMSGPIWSIERRGTDNTYTLAGVTDEWWLKARIALPTGGRVYMEQVLLANPYRYARLDEASGLVAADSSPNKLNGAYSAAGVTYGVAGAVAGDPDTAVTLTPASSGMVTFASATGLPTGAAAGGVALIWAGKFAANPASAQMLSQVGTNSTNQNLLLKLNTSGTVTFGNSTTVTSPSALSTGVYHLVVGVWDGANLLLYVDGALVAGPTAATLSLSYGATAWAIGASTSAGSFFAGQVDECAVAPLMSGTDVARLWASFNVSHAAYDARSGVASTVLLGYVNANLITPTNADRIMPLLVAAADPGVGTSVSGNARGDNLLTLLQQLASSGGDIGFRVQQTANGVLTFTVYQPVDRSGSAKFSQDLQNLFDYAYSLGGPNANAVMAWGGGVGAARTSVQVRDTSSIASWGLVEELIDARDTSDTATMQQRGQAEVNAQSEQTNLALTPRDTASVQYGRDYNLGDIVAVTIDGNIITNKIRSVHIQLQAPDQEIITPGIGNPSQGEVARWFDAYASRQQALTRVQARLNGLITAQ